MDWFTKILLQNTTYQNWQALDLNFSPYDEDAVDEKDDIEESDLIISLSLDHLDAFLLGLIENFGNPHVQKIIKLVIDHYNINEESTKIPGRIGVKIDYLFAN